MLFSDSHLKGEGPCKDCGEEDDVLSEECAIRGQSEALIVLRAACL